MDFFLNKNDLYKAKPSRDYKSEAYELQIGKEKVFLLKPQTYMNDSGLAVKAICNFYKINTVADLLIVHDDTDLDFGRIKLAVSSSSAGHNGVQSIINELHTQDFQRIRIGVEARDSRMDMPTDAFVLQDFTGEEIRKLQAEIFPKVQLEMEKFLQN